MDVEVEIGRLYAEIAGLRTLSTDVAVMQRDVEEIRTDVREVKDEQVRQREEKDRERKEAVKERKSDRRWQFGASITAASFVVTAAGLLWAALGGPG